MDSDEWTSNIVTTVQGIVKKALTEERIAIVYLLKQELNNGRKGSLDRDDINDIVNIIQNRKLNFRGVQI